jgi:hypothetical protein
LPWTPRTIPVAISTVNTRKNARAARPFTRRGLSDPEWPDKVSNPSPIHRVSNPSHMPRRRSGMGAGAFVKSLGDGNTWPWHYGIGFRRHVLRRTISGIPHEMASRPVTRVLPFAPEFAAF